MRFLFYKSIVVAWLCLFFWSDARAQPVSADVESIDCTVANADVVLIGKVVELGPQEEIENRDVRVATIEVEKTLKGKHQARRKVRIVYPKAVLADGKEQSPRLLLSATGYPLTATTAIDLASDRLEVLTADLKLLRTPEDVVQAAVQTVKRWPGVREIETFDHRLSHFVSPEVFAGTRWAESHGIRLTVPVDERLEKRAHDYIHSKSYLQREEAARALRYFKSDENIARVKELLNDHGWAFLHRAEENQGIEVRIYGVRREAYRTLRYWGVQVEKPQIREEIVKLESVKLVDLSHTKVTNQDLRNLARFNNLESLYLYNVPLTDANLKEIAKLKNLRTLSLEGAKVSDEGVAELRKLRPDLKIKR